MQNCLLYDLWDIVYEYTGEIRTLVFARGIEESFETVKISEIKSAYFFKNRCHTLLSRKFQNILIKQPFLSIALAILRQYNISFEISGSFVLHFFESSRDWRPDDIDIFIHGNYSSQDFALLRQIFLDIDGVTQYKPAIISYGTFKFHILYLESHDTRLNIINVKKQTDVQSAASSFDLQICQCSIRKLDDKFRFCVYNIPTFLDKYIMIDHPNEFSHIYTERNLTKESSRILRRIQKYWRRGYRETDQLYYWRLYLQELRRKSRKRMRRRRHCD